MRFPLETRELLWAAGGREVEIDWPECPVVPEPHRTYTVQAGTSAGSSRILVIAVLDDGLRARVKVDDDEVRLLAKSGGYTSRPSHALKTGSGIPVEPMGGPQFRPEMEPEALSHEDQAAISRNAVRAKADRIRVVLGSVADQLTELQDDPDFSHHRSDVRFLRSLTRKLEARLTTEDTRYLADLEEAS